VKSSCNSLLNYLGSWPCTPVLNCPKSESESELLYDRRFTANQFVLATSPLRLTTGNFIFQLNTCGYSLTRGCLSFTIDAGPRQCSHSQIRVPRDSWPYFAASDSRLPQLEGPSPRTCIPQEQGGPIIPPGTGLLPHARVMCYVTTDGPSASLSWNKAHIWGLRPDFYYCQTIAGLLMWGALSDEGTGLSFTMYSVQYIYVLHAILHYSLTNLI
jgi:hypothetical protein